MSLNIENTRNYLQGFDFKTLFIEELGWNNPKNKNAFPFQTKEGQFYRKAIAELSGATVYEISNEEGTIPDAKCRDAISKEIQKINFEHILIFIDKKRTQTIWRWVKKQDKKNLPLEHYFSAGQSGDSFIGKIAGLMVDISEIENNITITDVAKKMQAALDVERVTKQFYNSYKDQFIDFINLIEGIDNEADKRWYASVILNRIMFIYFLQKKGFIANGKMDYLYSKLQHSQKELGKNQYYSIFLKTLFFEGFAQPEDLRSPFAKQLLDNIKYLNGGLFLKHKIEEKYPKIDIPDIAFENLLQSDEPKGLFERFSWSLNDTPGGDDNEISPDVLGYIFEKYINQKAFGAYYTRTEITEYLCEQTVYKLILNAVNEEEVDPELLKKSGLDKLPKTKHYDTISELLLNLDAATCRKLVNGEKAVIPNLSLLDPACGSGAFLVAAMKTLINVYSAILGRIDFLGDKKLIEWKKKIEENHPSINYYIKKQIITNNLYGVDIMEEATEIAKLRLFLALVASAQTVDQLEPLPNIDFNIMCGNSLIGLLRVDANQFNKHFQPASPKPPQGKIVQKATLFNAATAQANLFGGELAKSYQQLINEKEAAVSSYKNAHKLGIKELQSLRDSIQKQEAEANKILNELLLEEFTTLGIKYEQVTWDDTKNKEGKPIKRLLTLSDMETLQPFHWGYNFSEIFRKKDGFDAIITNPPWEVFKPNSKEFFLDYSKTVSRKKMSIKDFDKEKETVLKDDEIRKEWTEYLSKFPHISSYYRSSNQYKNQISVVNGKKAGTDINLYKLFTEQCFNLLKKNAYCGIVIPSGIYTDLGTKQLRKMLFEQNKLTGLFCFENRKEIFEGVDSRFKFVVLSFEKKGTTKDFPAAFMRHDVQELQSFPQYGASQISIEFIKKQSPDSLSVMEIKNGIDFILAEKMLHFPMLKEEILDKWNIKLGNEFHMTNDSHIFQTYPSKTTLPLFEGKMIWQFDAYYANPKYWIEEKVGRKSILGRKEDILSELDYQKFRIGFREIASSTNERGLIATILPKNVFANHKIMLSTSCSIGLNDCCKVLLTAFLNSFVFDFQVRQRTSTSISMHIFYQLPVPRLSPKDKWYQPIIERAAKLICTTEEFAELWEEVMKTKWSEKVAAINEMERNILRAELDGIIAHIYGLTEEEFTYILSTFPIVPLPQKAAALDCYKSLTSQFEEDDVAVKAVTDLIEKGECPTIEFKSTLRVDLKTEKPEKYIEHSVIKTLAAFLNSEGGTLLIGVEDNKNVIGLEPDFISFSKPNKLDEFQKHFDNLISKTIGNRFHHYLKIDFIKIDGKMICSITIKEKSLEPVYITNEAGQEIFYIRRQASTIDLKPSETVKYIQEHWRQKAVAQEENLNVNSLAMFESRDSFHKGFIDILSQSDSAYFKEIKDHWNAYSLLNDKPFLSKLIVDNLSKSIDYGLLHFMSDYVSRHLYNDKDAKYLYNQPHVYMHNHEEEGYDMPAYYHIRFIGILYATAILNKIDIDNVSSGFKNMQSIFSGMIEGMLNNLRDNEVDNEKEFPTNYHWLIGQIFSITGNWLDTFNDPDNFVETSSYVDFIPFNIRLCLSELYKGVEKGKISKKFVISQCYYGVINHYFSPLLNNSLRESIEKNIIANIPNEFVKPILEFSLDEAYAIRFDQFCKGDFRLINLNEKKILNRLRSFLISSKKINL